MKEFKISNKTLGESNAIFIIAEAGDNHLGSISVAKEMCLQAKLAGADAVKFQHHLVDEEMLNNKIMSDNFEEPLYDFLKKNALNIDQHLILKEFCDAIGIIYMCTPFSYAAALELDTIGIDCFKIGSGEMTDIPSLLKIAELGHPMIISTGMSTFSEIDRTYNAMQQSGVPLILTNCLSEYPPKYEDVNVDVITEMKNRYPNALIGHSDHTPDIYTSLAATMLYPVLIEKHVILDKRSPGPDQSVSLDFKELAQLVDGVKKIQASRGSEKVVHEKEEKIREWAFRSCVTTQTIRKGEKLSYLNVWTKRPGTGIPSHQLEELIGRVALDDIQKDTLIKWENLA